MGHYGYLKYDSHVLMEFKNGEWDRIVGHYFQKDDYTNYSYLSYEDTSWEDVDAEDPWSFIQRFIGYRASSTFVLQRLAIFNKTLDSVVNSIWHILSERIELDQFNGEVDQEREYIKNTFSCKKCKNDIIKYYSRYLANRNGEKFDKRISRFGKWLISFGGPLDNLSIDENVICAIYSLGQGAYLEYDLDDIVFIDYDEFEDEELRNPKVTVLTEGRTDARIISKAFAVLKPHIKDFFHVIDFEGPSVAGGASYLTQAVKVFAGCNIEIPIVAIFDNDTAGRAEMLMLEKVSLPSSIYVCQYPNIESLNEYPCVGYNNLEICNINGRAASIELYLGSTCLRDEKGELRSVVWSAFDKRVGQYQGAIEKKDKVMKAFEGVLKNTSVQSLSQFDDLRKLLDVIEHAFLGNNEFQVAAIL